MAVGAQSLAGGVSGTGGIDAVLFDVGGVILRLADIATLGSFNGHTESQPIKELWSRCEIVRAHETGVLSADAFAVRMVETYAMGCAPEEFLARFCAWPREVFPGAGQLLADLDPRLQIACLSNTCDIHWRTMIASADMTRLFKRQFLSFRWGLMKPDAEIYLRAISEFDCAPERILFFDDNQANVDGACAVGIDAHLVDGPDGARAILESYGLLRGGTTSSGST
jgi:FMN phosphatase YigB (HAD superfamily)